MASASASTGRVICLERNSASQTLEKKTKTVISKQHEEKGGANLVARAEELPVNGAPERMRVAVWLSPCGMGSATTTTLPEAVADMPSAYSWPATFITGSSLRCAAESRLAESGPCSGIGFSLLALLRAREAGWPGSTPAAPESWPARADPCRRPPQNRRASVMRWEPSSSCSAGRSRSGAPEAAIDSASTRALVVTYCASSSTTRVESSRNSEVLGENQRSMERFMSRKLNRNMKTAGVSAISAAPSTMRVRSRAPRALLLWSA